MGVRIKVLGYLCRQPIKFYTVYLRTLLHVLGHCTFKHAVADTWVKHAATPFVTG